MPARPRIDPLDGRSCNDAAEWLTCKFQRVGRYRLFGLGNACGPRAVSSWSLPVSGFSNTSH